MQEWKEYVEIELPDDMEIFATKYKWSKSKLKGLLDVQTVTGNRLRIKIDNRKLKKEYIIDRIGGVEYK